MLDLKDDLLDLDPPRRGRLFALLSLMMALLIIALMIYSMLVVDLMTYDPMPPRFRLQIMRVLSTLGFIFTCISFRKEEHNYWVKWVGAVVNVVIFALVMLAWVGMLF